jgi:hypothetical protein
VLGAVFGLLIAMTTTTVAWGQVGKQVAVAPNADGRLEAFFIGTDDALYHSWQVARNGDFNGDAVPLGDYAKQIVVGQNADGRLEVFYIGLDDYIYHINQVTPNGGWGGVYWLAGPAEQLSVAQNADGRLEVFYLGFDSNIYHINQVWPNGGWGGVYGLAGPAKQIALGRNQDGRLEVFYTALNDAIYHVNQVWPNGGWGGVYSLGGAAKQLVVAQNADGRLELFYIGTNDALYHNWEKAPNGITGWFGEAGLGGFARQITVGRNADGRLEEFHVGTNSALYHNWQDPHGASGGWSGESRLALGDRGWAKQITVAANADGRLEVFYIGPGDDNGIYHRSQVAPNSDWGGEGDLAGTFMWFGDIIYTDDWKPLSGVVMIGMLQNGWYSVDIRAHYAGFGCFHYGIAADVATRSPYVFGPFQHQEELHGTLCSGSPDDEWATTGYDAGIAANWGYIKHGKLFLKPDGQLDNPFGDLGALVSWVLDLAKNYAEGK